MRDNGAMSQPATCPGCGEAMHEMQEESVVVDFCAACGGLWLDQGELAAKGAKLPEKLAPVTPGTGRSCPRCMKPLGTFHAGEVEVDSCASCGGLYLDRGELERLRDQTTGEERRADVEAFGRDVKETGTNVALWASVQALSALLDGIL
jgi:Zn-finger nucleic acid-binding protein